MPDTAARRGIADDPRSTPRVIRAGIYVRVSTDEQTALEYNSLQAQEEICRTYTSMRSGDPAAKEQWIYTATYSDPGVSGGTLARPGLQRLLRDVEAGRLDVIVTYKLDRFSRSIGQFYQVWTILERQRVDLVSVTQDLNTGTAQGRLVLNVLLAFAQHERELTSERTKDKIASAKRRGRWCGGTPLLGFTASGGRLSIEPTEAGRAREIFEIYLRELSLTAVVRELDLRGWTTKSWTRQDGARQGGRAFDKPTLLRLLRNPLYCGKVRANGSLVAGEHEAIVSEETWARVQTHLSRNGRSGLQRERTSSGALLKGLLRCGECGSTMTPCHTVKHSKGRVTRYRYYRCALTFKKGAYACPTSCVTAADVERQVVDRIRAIGRDPVLVAETARQAKAQLEERVRSLEAERRLLGKELQQARAGLTRLAGKRHRNGEEPSLADRLAALEGRIRKAQQRVAEIDRELEAAKARGISEREIAIALAQFNGVWDALFPAERARIIGLLVEEVRYSGRDEAVVVAFRRAGFRDLAARSAE